MCISPEKSNYDIFSRKKTKLKLNLCLFNSYLPVANSIKFLGIVFDDKLMFKNYIDVIKEKCNTRLNLIKVLSKKSWGLSHFTLSTLYKTLIGSIID